MANPIRSVYRHPPILVGGRQPIKPGRHPHLAEIVPEIAISRSRFTRHIREMIWGGKSIIILGLPGTGKSFLVERLAGRFDFSFIEFKTSDKFFKFAESYRPGSVSRPILLDDMSSIIHNILEWEKVIDLINKGQQLVFLGPPQLEPHYASFIRRCQPKHAPQIIILPAADFPEFSDSLRNPYSNYYLPLKIILNKENIEGTASISDQTTKILFDLTGGNFRITDYVLNILAKGEKKISSIRNSIFNGKKPNSAQIKKLYEEVISNREKRKKERWRWESDPLKLIRNNFSNVRFTLLPFSSKFTDGKMKIADFWRLDHDSPERNEILRVLKYGLIKVEGDTIAFRGSLVQQEFNDS